MFCTTCGKSPGLCHCSPNFLQAACEEQSPSPNLQSAYERVCEEVAKLTTEIEAAASILDSLGAPRFGYDTVRKIWRFNYSLSERLTRYRDELVKRREQRECATAPLLGAVEKVLTAVEALGKKLVPIVNRW